MKIEIGDTVHLEYTGKFETGEIFDTSNEETAKKAGIHMVERNYGPLVVKIGAGQMIKGLDEALVGVEKDESKTITVPPERGYGLKSPDLIQNFPRDVFTQSNIEPKVGVVLGTDQGVATVTNVSENQVEMDFNHPLAGKTLVFEVKILIIEKE